ncbi:hypothetical protein INR49_024521 [Caranx melampygus]|nr:hypothetical protein INR49_024521 [Caranx melampygus]
MEKFFKPVHSPSAMDEIKPRKHHRHHHLHHHHHQDLHSHRYTMFDDTDRNTDDSHGHPHHHHAHYLHDSSHHDAHHHHQTPHFHHSEEDDILYNHHTPVTLSRASSSSLSSSSSSSSSSSWYTEASANDPFSLRHAERPQHSLSCSNILDARRGFREDDSSEPIVFATMKHGKKAVFVVRHRQAHDIGVPHMNYGPLYKTASLNRSLAFSEEDILLGVSRGPKRAVSSSQLPSKGILKNKDPHTDIRKAKSMEVLSPRVSKESDPTGQKGKGITQAEMEQARSNFVQGKLQFSAFLDEITKQVISPSDLTILGVNNNNKSTGKTPVPASKTPSPVKPQLPPKKHKETPGEERGQHSKQHSRQEKAARSSSRKHSDCSNPDKLISYAGRNHHGSPHLIITPALLAIIFTKEVAVKTEGRLAEALCQETDMAGVALTLLMAPAPALNPANLNNATTADSSPLLLTVHTPSTSNSTCHSKGSLGLGTADRPTPLHPQPRVQEQALGLSLPPQSPIHPRPETQPPRLPVIVQSRVADTIRIMSGTPNNIGALQEENADLHQNLLQTVVCIESLEAELQRTREELSHVKEKYKSLLETHTGTKQANNLLGEHLHIAVPCLIKDLLEKHFDSSETIQKFLTASPSISHSATSPQGDSQSHTPKMEEAAHDWSAKSEAGPQRLTAFMPFKQELPTTGTEARLSNRHESSHSPPFSVSDISAAIYKKMAAGYAARPKPLYPQSQQQPPLATNHANIPPSLQQAHVGGDSWGAKPGVQVTLLEQDVVNVTSMSAQHILDDFMQQLQTHKEPGGGTEPQGGKEWVGGAEETGRAKMTSNTMTG